MNTIMLYCSKGDRALKENLISLLSESHTVNIIESEKIYSIGHGSDINVIVNSDTKAIDIQNAILLIGAGARLCSVKHICRSCRAVVCSGDKRSIERLSRYSVRLYTCGFSSKDYITFSSREADSAVLSLQRSIHCGSSICEPFEVSCNLFGNVNDYSILELCITLILLGWRGKSIQLHS